MRTENMEPCPFCGGAVALYDAKMVGGGAFIVCHRCHYTFGPEPLHPEWTEKEALEIWSRRAKS